MLSAQGYHAVDLAMFAQANLINLLMAGIFLSRPAGWRRLGRVRGSNGFSRYVAATTSGTSRRRAVCSVFV